MNSKNKLFSGALFLENLRRFWLIDLAALVFYFLSAPIEIISENGNLSASLLKTVVSSNSPGFIALGIFLPVIAAVTVFSYLNKTGSVGVLHAMPFSRRNLFNTNYISGLIISIVPLALTCLVLLCLIQPVSVFVTEYSTTGQSSVIMDDSIYTAALVFKVFGIHLLNIFFVYSLSVLACTLSGNGVIATLTACAFNCLAPAFYICLMGYSENYLFGFDAADEFESIVKLHPIMQSVVNHQVNGAYSYTAKYMLLYVLIAIVASIAAFYVYKLRPLETAGDSYSFGAMEKFVVICITFLFSSAFGIVFMELFESKAVAYSTFFLTAVAAFIIGQMIAKKSFHVFNLDSLKLMVISLLIVLAILLSFVFDVFGFEKKMPDRQDVEYAEINSWGLFLTNDGYMDLHNPENIDLTMALQRDIIRDKKEIKQAFDLPDDTPYEYSVYGRNIDIRYFLKDGSTFLRSYVVPNDYIFSNDNLDKIRQSDEVLHGLYALRDIDFNGAEIVYTEYGDYETSEYSMPEDNGYPKSISLPEDIMPALVEAIIADTISNDGYKSGRAYTYESDGYIDIQLPVHAVGFGTDDARSMLYKQFQAIYGFNWVEEAGPKGMYCVHFGYEITDEMKNTLELLPKL